MRIKNIFKAIFLILIFLSSLNAKDINVGVDILSTYFGKEKTNLKMSIWYPTYEESKKIVVGPYLLDIVKNAKPIDKKYKLIIISHGSKGSYLSHNDTATFLVKKGYLVLSILHPHDNYKDFSNSNKAIKLVNRPKHIEVAINTILNNKKFKTLIDRNKIGIIGFSAGGYTALSLLGAKANTKDIIDYCSKKISKKSNFCTEEIDASKKNKKIIEGNLDKRIKAAVLLAPLGIVFNHKNSLDAVNVPIQIYEASKDEILMPSLNSQLIKEKLKFKPEYVIVKNASHYSFLAPFIPKIKNDLGILSEDPKGFNRIEFHKILNREISDFFNRKLIDN